MKRYCIRTITRDVGALPTAFPHHDEEERGAWVRWEDVEALLVRLESLAAQLDEDCAGICGKPSAMATDIRAAVRGGK